MVGDLIGHIQWFPVTERGPKHRKVPALTSYKSVASAGMIDITNNRSSPWLLAMLNQLRQKYHIDSFYLDMGEFTIELLSLSL
ncbi:hypothetical protein LSTR_LSTR016004 [Laodelphax striatellus]|uniref:Uncharacterized protein n=1 Tax=Laodelphax striatellus TaxID=195883 RepID=A0A482WST1_LAOST|nr:hypothetical protein LSTR_LSTR016004 [Laodelphax striatellus]